jgi:hypothetical protein
MKTFKKNFLIAAVVVIALTGCKKPADGVNGTNGANGATGPALAGTLEAYVDLFDQYGDLMTPATGVYVTCPTKSGTDSTNASGMFTKSLTTGTYELDFAKTGYGAMKIPSLNFTGGGMQYIQGHIQMAQVPTYSLLTATGLSVGTTTLPANNNNAGPALTVTVTTAATDVKNRKAIVFYNTSATVSSTPGNYLGFQVVNIPVLSTGSTSGSTNIPVSASLYESGVTSGSTLYLIAYPISFNANASAYSDVTTGKTIFNNVNTSGATSVQSIVVP